MDNIELRKQFSKILKDAASSSKKEECYLCKQKVEGFCNSHLVPAFVLRNIAKDGYVSLMRDIGLEKVNLLDETEGVNKAGTFRFICRKCDSTFFQDYENQEALLGEITTKIMGEIAVKDSLLKLSKRNLESSLYSIMHQKGAIADGMDVIKDTHRLDIRDFEFSLKRSKKIVENNLKSGYCIVFKCVLPYVVPIAIQSEFAIDKNIDGTMLNDVNNFSQEIRIQDVHLAVFPLESKSLVLLFYHKDDRIYCKFEKQFNKKSFEEKLVYINYLIFKYNEDFFIAPDKTELLDDKKLKTLAKEMYSNPNYGQFEIDDLFMPYKEVSPYEIPNFLSEINKLR